MSTSREPQFMLLWKGRESGPYSLEAIREKLGSGEISRMHQVNFNGKWMVLDEFLEKHAGREPEAQRKAEAERVTSLSHLLPPPPPPPLQPQYHPAPGPAHEISTAVAVAPVRTSGLAIAALVMGLCNFVPFLNFVTWILALVFGHIALSQMKRDTALEGRGMAIAGLAITYFLLVLGLTFAVLMAVNKQPLF